MLEGFTNIMEDEVIEDITSTIDIKNIITNLNLYTNDPDTLTMLYTNILSDENVVYIMTRVSQNMVFMKHFPEFYVPNLEGECVINCQQNSPYHKYGVFKHILHTIEYVGKENSKLNVNDIKLLKWTMFLHDIGKPSVKITNPDGNDSFGGHDDASVQIAQGILDRLSFTEHEKKIILTLIRYHDRYLNDGELTKDNFEFLVKELEDKRELFNLLIEVKLADNKAKSIEVNKRFILAVKKYYEFADIYFAGKGETKQSESTILKDIKIEANESNTFAIIGPEGNEKQTKDQEKSNNPMNSGEVTDENFESLYKGLINEKEFNYFYQPIININKKEIYGYEVCAELNAGNNINIENMLKKSRDFKKYDRVQQLIFINTLNNFVNLKIEKELLGFINIDVESYDKYINKGRIFDMLDNRNIVISFYNYSKYNNTEFRKLVKALREKGGLILLNNYDDNNLQTSNLDVINPDYIKYYLPREETSERLKSNIKDLLTYCIASETKLIMAGVNTQEDLDVAIECGAEFVQGNLFGHPSQYIEFDKEIKEKFNNSSSEDEKII